MRRRTPSQNHMDKHVGMMLRLFRLNRKMTQVEVAEKVGSEISELRDYERGGVTVPAMKLNQLCKIYEVRMSQLFARVAITSSANDN